MERILIIQLSRLGDLVQTVPLLMRLKEDYRNCNISVLCLKEFSCIMEMVSCVDKLIRIPQRYVPAEAAEGEEVFASARKKVLEIPELRQRYDLVINLTHSLFSSQLCSAVASENKLGRVASYAGEIRALGDWAKYLFAISKQRAENLFNIVDMYVGIGNGRHAPVEPVLTVEESAYNKAVELLKVNGYEGKSKLVAFQMGANQLHRVWPVDKFAALATELRKEFRVGIVLLGTREENRLAREFCMKTDIPVINLVGKTTITDLPAVLKHCDLLISHDTGTIHIAAATGTKTLGLYFSTAYFAETAPYGEGHVVIQAEMPCSPCRESQICDPLSCRAYITVEVVAAVAKRILEGVTHYEEIKAENIMVYVSRFLPNGTLIYIPVCPDIPSRYLTSVVIRLMWESFFGIGNGKSLLEMLSLETVYANHIGEEMRQYIDTLDLLGQSYGLGVEAAKEIIREAENGAPNHRRILEKVSDLSRIESTVSTLEGLPGQIRDFHNMEMMDMGYVRFPELAVEYVKKYQRLGSLAGCCFSAVKNCHDRWTGSGRESQ